VQGVVARIALLAVFPMLLNSDSPQALVIDSGSTNRAGFTIKIDESGNATVEQSGIEPKSIQVNAELGAQLMRDIKSAGVLSALPRKRCIKSASFGSSLFVEWNGDRSPDLSCSPQIDPRAEALQKDARQVVEAVQKQAGLLRVRPGRPASAGKAQ
jgi:hypothetical protein